MPKPYILSGDPDAGMVERIDDMLRELYELSGATSAHNLLSALHGDTTAADPAAGALIIGVGTKWTRVVPLVAGTFPRWDGANTTFAKVDITSDISGVLPIANGGTALSTYAAGDILYASAANVLAKLAKDTNATRYLSNKGASNVPAWSQVTLTDGVTGVLPSTNGGTGQSTYTTGAMVYYGGTIGQLDKLSLGANNTFLQAASGVGPVWSAFALPAGVNQGDIFYASSTSVVAVLAKDSTATRYLSNTGGSNNPAWLAASKGRFDGNSGGLTVAGGVDVYMGPYGYSATEGSQRFPMPFGGVIKNLYARADNVPGVGQSYTYTVMVNGSATSIISSTSGGSANTSNDTTHTATVSAGDFVSIKLHTDGAATVARHNAAFEISSSA